MDSEYKRSWNKIGVKVAVVLKIYSLGPVPERCNNPNPGINVPGMRHIYPWNRIITPFGNRTLVLSVTSNLVISRRCQDDHGKAMC